MTGSKTIQLIADLDDVQDRLLAEERTLDEVMEGGGAPPEEGFDAWHRAYDRYRNIREEILEVVSQEPDELESSALMALEMADLRSEAREAEWELRSLLSLGFDKEGLEVQLAQAKFDACSERIAELKSRLDLLKPGVETLGPTVVPAAAAALDPRQALPVQVTR